MSEHGDTLRELAGDLEEKARKVHAHADDLAKQAMDSRQGAEKMAADAERLREAAVELDRRAERVETIPYEEPATTRAPGTYSDGELPPLAPIEGKVE